MGQDQVDIHRHSRVLFRRPARAPASRFLRDVPLDQSANVTDLHHDHLNNLARLGTLQGSGDRIAAAHSPNAEILSLRPASFWLRHQAVPIDMLGRTVMMLMADPRQTEPVLAALSDRFEDLITVPAPEKAIEASLTEYFSAQMTQSAARSVPRHLSCRSFDCHRARAPAVCIAAVAILAALLAPGAMLSTLVTVALVSLLLFTSLRVSGLLAAVRSGSATPARRDRLGHSAPLISMVVPLYRESEIGRHLLRRLCRLTYPRDKMEVLLVLEEHDDMTRAAVECADLPDWFRVVEVPGDGPLTTKPRAMNYALNYCRGEIIGIWDAEDAPEAKQLDIVADAFERAPSDVACLQGVLDFYNPSCNWISRCFTLEYAGWFRVLLQGIARLGLVVPLGGTTLFIRRDALEQLGAWDAHNVTEDADLGVRLARAGFRTEMLPTATHEEANSRVIPWIKQRSRWLKGFMMTYMVHMRSPGQLLSDLGWRKFLGFQAFFLGTLGQFLLAPVLWSLWLVALGLSHPSDHLLPQPLLLAATTSLIFFEALNLCIWIFGARASGRAWLALWAPLMPLYFVMGCFAAYKALWEVFAAPFFWDKTAHGEHGGAADS
ncbi:glycosyltransferase [Tritonibacter horizontis]|uniref:Beta-monoglucosyldiacylglycerol synthase n=1 Tax=Tritonibacter horizontis TaxID=1768241 RepID=A0A132C067_9RHOB|nr:glycosyltransferase [Tritonibacter horizontis]KUP93974.1 beta-monoglucosyldiacylglycerol synthase [Tritonibacter horizontis]